MPLPFVFDRDRRGRGTGEGLGVLRTDAIGIIRVASVSIGTTPLLSHTHTHGSGRSTSGESVRAATGGASNPEKVFLYGPSCPGRYNGGIEEEFM